MTATNLIFTPDQVRKFGLEPYAVYGGKVYSFKCPGIPDKVFDAALLPHIFADAQSKADETLSTH